MFETLLRHYRFKERTFAFLFMDDLKHRGIKFSTLKLRKGLPEYKGQANTGWAVFTKTYSVADELAVSNAFKAIADTYKMEGFYH